MSPRFSVARIYAYDITERKQAEEKLLRAKEEWERTFASVPDMVTIIDNQHRILRVNEAMARRLGHNAEECVGLRCFEAVHGLPNRLISAPIPRPSRTAVSTSKKCMRIDSGATSWSAQPPCMTSRDG